MADWFVTVDAAAGSDAPPTVVYECVAYREALALAYRLSEQHPDQFVELVDCEGRVLMVIGLDEWDGSQGRTSIPLRAGVYRWQDASETYRLVSL